MQQFHRRHRLYRHDKRARSSHFSMPPGLTFRTDGTVDVTRQRQAVNPNFRRARPTPPAILIRSFTIRVYPASEPAPGCERRLPDGHGKSVDSATDLQALGAPPYYSVTPGAGVSGLRVRGRAAGRTAPKQFFLWRADDAGSYPTSIRAMDSIGGVIHIAANHQRFALRSSRSSACEGRRSACRIRFCSDRSVDRRRWSAQNPAARYHHQSVDGLLSPARRRPPDVHALSCVDRRRSRWPRFYFLHPGRRSVSR